MRLLILLIPVLFLVACGDPPTTTSTTIIDNGNTPSTVTRNAIIVNGLLSAPAAINDLELRVNSTSNFYKFTNVSTAEGYTTEILPTPVGSSIPLMYGADVPLTSKATKETITTQCQFKDSSCSTACLIDASSKDSIGNQMSPPDNYVVSLTTKGALYVYSSSLSGNILSTTITVGSFYNNVGCQVQTSGIQLTKYYELLAGSSNSPSSTLLNSSGVYLPTIDDTWKVVPIQVSTQSPTQY